MLRNYILFELKILLRSRKQWILGLVLVLFFPLFYFYYQNTEPLTVEIQKTEEKMNVIMILDMVPENLRDTPEGQEIYNNLTAQLSLLNMQIYYVVTEPGQAEDNFLEDGLALNELRLEMHEKGNPYIPEYLIIPEDEIYKESDYLSYIQEHNLTIENNLFVTSHFLVAAAQFLSGILLLAYILFVGSDMLVYEQKHKTLLKGFPISFLKKAISKIGIHYIYIILCLSVGVGIGVYRSAKIESLGNFTYPIMIYTKNGYEIISIAKYLMYVSFAFIIITALVLSLALFLEIIFKNLYATIIVGLGIFAVPQVLYLIGLKAKFLYPITYINITGVLSGELAEKYGESYIDYWHSITWMSILTVILLVIIFVQNKLSFEREETN